jgi:hypothetical protein
MLDLKNVSYDITGRMGMESMYDEYRVNITHESEIGYLDFLIFGLPSHEHGLLWSLDNHSSNTAEFCSLFKMDGCLTKQAERALEHEIGCQPSVLIFDMIKLMPIARGQKLSLKVIDMICERFKGSVDIAVCQCYPQQIKITEGNKEDEKFEYEKLPKGTEKQLIKKLGKLYNEADFNFVKGTKNLMIRSLINY